jgi:hypothetical protein
MRGDIDPRTLANQAVGLSGLYRKLAKPPNREISQSLCCWSDLLGFGDVFYRTNWNPSATEWDGVFDRIAEAHACCYNGLESATEFVLTLNDGIVRCCDAERITHLDLLSFWFRACVWTHNWINEREKYMSLPGARTVLAAGAKLVHSTPELHLDDFVLDYTKAEPGTLSNVAKQAGNPAVALNPLPLQLNLAFSKAYVLETLGSKVGVQGAHFFIDQSVIEFAVSSAEHDGRSDDVVDIEDGVTRTFAIRNTYSNRYHFGFRCDREPVDIDTDKMRTRVWRVVAFYPCDEDLPFQIDVL